ncbi:hypothetical protein acsn021_01800 [Anaerocolumna cellulosilytica]|uniref:Uncharacterized protein n=1 Tax=Anaerocolumna cellulosilytica TaxID=433286 RepID=A0A6S6R045_9FIRM|nr:DUF4280 domain-containing protein [Anaerocolumna cellulosilytica]MBB5197916.1 hypothetical protein [Anaerocolumna cellulosilytica]BCJ92611.1 hypothetical protein acsn021_01800 [Anaerocolumna cellulosilytica]
MAEEEESYLVRGAMLYCNCGSHPRRLNLPKCHGVYVLNHPVIREDDCEPGKNISYFGVCLGETPPAGAEEILLDQYVPEGETGTGEEIQGPRCAPDIIGKWRSTNEATCVSGDGTAVTTNSYLVCRCGGLIQPITNGHEYEE